MSVTVKGKPYVEPHKCELPAGSKLEPGARALCNDCGAVWLLRQPLERPGVYWAKYGPIPTAWHRWRMR